MSFLSGEAAQALIRYGDDGLAVYTNQYHLYLLSVSSIPLLPAPVPSAQPVLPATPGVTVVDLATQDIAYDSARDLIYAATPNREAALGDLIASIDPASGSIGNTWSAGPNPHVLSMADDQSRLYVSVGAANNAFASGFSFASETIRPVDPKTGAIGDGFPDRSGAPADSSYGFVDLLAMPGQPASLAAIDNLYQYQNVTVEPGNYAFINAGPDSLRVYDGPVSRKNYLAAHTFTCNFLAPGANASRLYCSSGTAITKLVVDASGVTVTGSFQLLPGHGSFGRMTFSGNRLYTTTGLVLDPENNRTISRVEAQGPVAVEGGTVYWLDPSTYTTTNPIVTLRSFDITTLQPTGAREIKVTANDLTRLIVCGNGRLAFRAGHEIYIVNPN
jgi:hypothetical protein